MQVLLVILIFTLFKPNMDGLQRQFLAAKSLIVDLSYYISVEAFNESGISPRTSVLKVKKSNN